MTREAGMMYLLAIGEHGSEITDENLRDPFFTALELSTDQADYPIGYSSTCALSNRSQSRPEQAVEGPHF